MSPGDILLLTGAEVDSLLQGREEAVIDEVARAYLTHERGESSLPHSTFLRFPDDDANRIIGLPAFLGGDRGVAGFKWIASFPGNIERGIPRASAVLVLNDCETGQPTAILEGSIISAQRTAASAALAAQTLVRGQGPQRAGLIGTGFIHQQVARYLLAALPEITSFLVFDLDPARAESFGERAEEQLGVKVEVAGTVAEVLSTCSLISLATTAAVPHLGDLSMCPKGATILHVSLRDIDPAEILRVNNVVDDPDHVCRASTSIHLAEQATGSRDFIWCTLAQMLAGHAPPEPLPGEVRVFSPFGLGVLDLALGQMVCDLARLQGFGRHISGFLPS